MKLNEDKTSLITPPPTTVVEEQSIWPSFNTQPSVFTFVTPVVSNDIECNVLPTTNVIIHSSENPLITAAYPATGHHFEFDSTDVIQPKTKVSVKSTATNVPGKYEFVIRSVYPQIESHIFRVTVKGCYDRLENEFSFTHGAYPQDDSLN